MRRLYKKQKSSIFKNFQKWQFHDGSYSQERDIIIGFDLGTACTKVLLQDRIQAKTFAISFDKFADQRNRYLLSSKVYFKKNGMCTLFPQKDDFSNLKIKYLENPEKEFIIHKYRNIVWTSYDLISAFVALVLVEVRNWFRLFKADEYKHIHISWEINIGLPSLDYDNEALTNKMRMAALAGWNISLQTIKEEVSQATVRSAGKLARRQVNNNEYSEDKGQIPPGDVNAIPEIVAQVVGYARSPQKEYGMYLIMDVGASTLDIATFIFHKVRGDNWYGIIGASVRDLGTIVLHNHRIDNYRAFLDKKLSDLDKIFDGIIPLPKNEKYRIDSLRETEKIIQDADKDFIDKCVAPIVDVIKESITSKNPLFNDWKNGCPVFLSGGGSKVNVYNKVLPAVEDKINPLGFTGFITKKLPNPSDLEIKDFPMDEYHRLAVSYGLSFANISVGEIMSQSVMKDYIIYEEGVRLGFRKRKVVKRKKHRDVTKYISNRDTQSSWGKFDYYDDWSAVKD